MTNNQRVIKISKSTDQSLHEITSYLHQEIPITGKMGLRVSVFNQWEISLSSPLAENINHKDTAFGGSLSSAAILACWTLIHLNLDKVIQNFQLVIQKSEILFDRPVHGNFVAICSIEDHKDWSRFQRALTKFGKSRIRLNSEVWSAGQLTCRHTGVYVAIRTNSSK